MTILKKIIWYNMFDLEIRGKDVQLAKKGTSMVLAATVLIFIIDYILWNLKFISKSLSDDAFETMNFFGASFLGKILGQLDTIISKFNPELRYFSKMSNHPLYEVGQILSKSKNGYDGDAHIEAAKTIDEELNDPLMAWDALVSAGYWSGVNFGIPNMDAWKSAIDLSEKHGWKEIHEVLTDQLEFYNHYKDKV